ncbi:IclR family transcriptional regulator [Comamonas sp. Z1]|nr:IclR family transcriptional regulator [Comamonas sp. Z1]
MALQNARQEPDQRRQRVQAAETCLAVLKALAGLGGRASLTAIGAAVDESPAKVHRYLASLMAEGLVEQDRGGTQYALGREAIHIGLAAMRQNDPVRMSEPALQHLRESLQVTSFVAVMGNMGPTIVRFEEPSLPITVNVRVGSVMSMLWSATGRAFFAFMEPQPEVEALLARELEAASPEHRRLLHASKPLEQLRSEIRAAGCAAIRDLNLPGISAVAAPLLDYNGHVVAVLCALGASGGFDPDPQGRIAQAVREEARSISASLGYRA